MVANDSTALHRLPIIVTCAHSGLCSAKVLFEFTSIKSSRLNPRWRADMESQCASGLLSAVFCPTFLAVSDLFHMITTCNIIYCRLQPCIHTLGYLIELPYRTGFFCWFPPKPVKVNLGLLFFTVQWGVLCVVLSQMNTGQTYLYNSHPFCFTNRRWTLFSLNSEFPPFLVPICGYRNFIC